MNKDHAQSNLFLIRLWVDQEGNRMGEWHGKVQQMNSSKWSSFEDWATLRDVLANMLALDSAKFEQMEEGQADNYPAVFP